MNKLYSSFLLIFITTNLFGQDLNDLIITKNQDSIICNITLVNDENIFYQYKKKKSIKTDYISRKLVLDFQGENLKTITVNKKDVKRYSKCDTCKNWIVDQDDDTIYYNLVVKYIEKEPNNMLGLGNKKYTNLIESIIWRDSAASSHYNICDIKSVAWNGFNYFKFKPDYRYEHSNLKYPCKSLLGYYVVQGTASLIRYSSVYEYNTMSTEHITMSTGGAITKSIRTTPEYCVEIDSQKIMIPKRNRLKHFRIAMMEVLYKDKKLVERIKNKEFEYEDIEKIINIYNQNIK